MSDNTARVLAALASKPKAAPAEPVWTQIDTETLNATATAALAKLRAANEAARAAREQFEAIITDLIDPADGERVIFGYRFGKLSLAIVPADKPKAKANAISLDAFKAK